MKTKTSITISIPTLIIIGIILYVIANNSTGFIAGFLMFITKIIAITVGSFFVIIGVVFIISMIVFTIALKYGKVKIKTKDNKNG